MPTTPYTIDRPDAPPPVVRVELRGSLNDAHQEAILASITGIIQDAPTTVVIGLSALGTYDPGLRAFLLELQRTVRGHQGRTVYVADRPRLRGLALWVVHMSEDPQAKIVSNMPAALEWLRITDERIDSAATRTLGGLARLSGRGGAR
ncbi:MAG: hypothetical protein R3B09_26540 [Nannocystaceae bacterium]